MRTSAHSSAMLTRNGIAICKFFLHLSKKEQKRRFLERLDNKDKHWKFSLGRFERTQILG